MMLFCVCFCLHVQATYEKGTTEEIEEFIYQFLDVNGDGILGRYALSLKSYVHLTQPCVLSKTFVVCKCPY